MHPSRGVPKTYEAKVRGQPAPEALERLQRGVVIDGRKTRPAKARRVKSGPNAWVELTIHEGHKHQVRLMFDAVGHRVVKLKRTRYGGVALGDLPRGEYRPLTDSEVAQLRRVATAGKPKPAKSSARRPRRN